VELIHLTILPEFYPYNDRVLGNFLEKLSSILSEDKMKCPECQTESPNDAKFCIECASPMEFHCPNCGAITPGVSSPSSLIIGSSYEFVGRKLI